MLDRRWKTRNLIRSDQENAVMKAVKQLKNITTKQTKPYKNSEKSLNFIDLEKSVQEKLRVVVDSRSKNIFYATVGPERV